MRKLECIWQMKEVEGSSIWQKIGGYFCCFVQHLSIVSYFQASRITCYQRYQRFYIYIDSLKAQILIHVIVSKFQILDDIQSFSAAFAYVFLSFNLPRWTKPYSFTSSLNTNSATWYVHLMTARYVYDSPLNLDWISSYPKSISSAFN